MIIFSKYDWQKREYKDEFNKLAIALMNNNYWMHGLEMRMYCLLIAYNFHFKLSTEIFNIDKLLLKKKFIDINKYNKYNYNYLIEETVKPKPAVISKQLLSPNLANSFSKCNLENEAIKYRFGKRKRDRFIEQGFISSKLVYFNVYNAGGTTIQNLLLELSTKHMVNFGGKFDKNKVDGDIIWWKYLLNSYNNTEYLFNIIKPKLLNNPNIYKFTFIRDPIDRFLNGFYEINRPYFDKPNYNKDKTGIELLRMLIEQIKSLRLQSNLDIDPYLNWNLWPNYKFLSDENWRPIQFDYIGYFKNINHDLPFILEPYLNQDIKGDHDMTMTHNSYYNVNGKTNNINNKYSINISMLTDGDIRNICSLYWMDYKCFSFNIPNQCQQQG